MKVFETELPGVGKRYTLSFPEGGAFVVVIENDGTRRAYWREDADADSDPLFEATEHEARKIAEVFDGTYFHPVDDGLEDAFDDARIRWLEVGDGSPLAGATIRESSLRSRTGVTVLAVQRGTNTISNPDPDIGVRAGDVLVLVGTSDAYVALDELLDD